MPAMDYEKPEVVTAPVNEVPTNELHRELCPDLVLDIESASTRTLNEHVDMDDPKERRGVKLWYA